MGYKYQMHAHTSPCSGCGRTLPEELGRSLYEGGYQGCVITNHFHGGNSGIDRALPWKDFVGQYVRDWEACAGYAARYDIDVIFSIEEHVGDGREILCYGITPEILTRHPELANRRIEDYAAVMEEAGGLVIQAHPFRIRSYIAEGGLIAPSFLDGIEVCNMANSPEMNAEAEAEAERHPDWVLTCGGDAHNAASLCIGGIETERRMREPSELVAILKSREYRLIK